MLTSSQGDGIKLRITSFLLLVVPVLNTMLHDKGVNIAPEIMQNVIDSIFYLTFTVIHIYAWVRSFNKPATSK